MAKFIQAAKRLFGNKFICKVCKSAIRAPNMKIIEERIRCRKCGSKAFRAVRKK